MVYGFKTTSFWRGGSAGFALSSRHPPPIFTFILSPQLGELHIKGVPAPIGIVHLGQRLKSKSEFVPNEPKYRTVRQWIKERSALGDGTTDGIEDEASAGILYEVPAGTLEYPLARSFGQPSSEAKDAVQILRSLKVARRLKSLADLDITLLDAIDCICATDRLADEVIGQMPDNPKPTALNLARLKLDAVTMNLERRMMQDLCTNRRHELQSAHLFTDASPVTGNELQGMVIDLCFASGFILTMVLPGVCMHFGRCRLVDKCAALLWALFLVVGHDHAHLQWLLSKVTSITTDQGTEFAMTDVPDFLHCFLRRLSGVAMDNFVGTVDLKSRLFPNAVKVIGWSHLFGNQMYFSCKQVDRWPLILECIRKLCHFFRNETWRKTIVDKAKRDYPAVKGLLKSFRAKLAKWRYETSFVCFDELLPLRFLCETYLRNPENIFGAGFQDKGLLQEIKTACNFGDLWAFIAVFHKFVLTKLEHARRWGLVCLCCHELRAAGAKRRINRSLRTVRWQWCQVTFDCSFATVPLRPDLYSRSTVPHPVTTLRYLDCRVTFCVIDSRS